MLKQTINRTFLGLTLLVATVLPATAGVEQIVTDFKPLSGYIVMDMQGEYIIDLDASHGVRVGDIFAAVTTGGKITHPVTGVVLGTLDEVRAQLRVNKVKTGYSYAVPLPESSSLKPGEAIQRFQGIPAAFWDYSGDGEPLYTELKSGLPALEWSDFASAQAQKPEQPQKIQGLEGLVFVLTGRGLEIKDATFQAVRFYSRSDLANQGVAIAATAPAVAVPPPAITPVTAAAAPPGIVAVAEKAPSAAGGIIQNMTHSEGIWYGPDMPGNIVGIETIDLDGDGRLDLATAFSNKILLGSMAGGNYTGKGFIDLPKRRRVIGIDSADLDRDGKLELYITALEPNTDDPATENLASMVAELVDGQMQIIADEVPYFLGSVDIPGEGKVILAQRGESLERTYSGRVYRLKRNGKKFGIGDTFELDYQKLTVHGFTPFDAMGFKLFALFDINEKLEVVDHGGNRLWLGGEALGGSQAYIAHKDPTSQASMPVNHFLKARISRLGDGTVLVPFNEGSTRIFGSREFTKSKLIAMQWDGRLLREIWQTEPQGGYMADFRVGDVDHDGKDEVIMAILYLQGGVLNRAQGRSSLVVYELP